MAHTCPILVFVCNDDDCEAPAIVELWSDAGAFRGQLYARCCAKHGEELLAKMEKWEEEEATR